MGDSAFEGALAPEVSACKEEAIVYALRGCGERKRRVLLLRGQDHSDGAELMRGLRFGAALFEQRVSAAAVVEVMFSCALTPLPSKGGY